MSIAMESIMGIIVMIPILAFMLTVKFIFSLIFFPGQYNKKFHLTEKEFILEGKSSKKQFLLNQIEEFAWFSVRKYGQKIHIKASGETLKFFSPDAHLIEKDLKAFFETRNKNLEMSRRFLPFVGRVYVVANSE